MIDFTNAKEKNKGYAGANGSKICIVHDGEQYMLKFPSLAQKNDDMSYSNSVISEYLACHIFNSISIPVQETVLGTYNLKGKEKMVVACKDFATKGWVIQDFASLKNRVIDSERQGHGTDLYSILETIEEQKIMDSTELKKFFWDIFIGDALIGNWDRHNGNWGFLYNEMTDEIKLAPVWDCGSSLYPQADEDLMKTILSNDGEKNHRIYNIPTSALKINDKRINYFDFISSGINEDCTEALKRIAPRIDLEKINQIVQNIECIHPIQKEFYQTMIRERKEKIIDQSLKIIERENRNQDHSLTKHATEGKTLAERKTKAKHQGQILRNQAGNKGTKDIER